MRSSRDRELVPLSRRNPRMRSMTTYRESLCADPSVYETPTPRKASVHSHTSRPARERAGRAATAVMSRRLADVGLPAMALYGNELHGRASSLRLGLAPPGQARAPAPPEAGARGRGVAACRKSRVAALVASLDERWRCRSDGSNAASTLTRRLHLLTSA
jgi:hypothetical protein